MVQTFKQTDIGGPGPSNGSNDEGNPTLENGHKVQNVANWTSMTTCSMLRGSDYHEKKFMNIIDALGSFKIKKAESPRLQMPYYKIKLTCNKSRHYELNTIVVGDEFDEEDCARENAFRKAYDVLFSRFKQQVTCIEKKMKYSKYSHE